jgi:succinate-semialdehyde dehydrogenase/glutarate-semialdehyde dehydrogenase
MYENLSFYIDGKFVPASNGRGQDVVNPATGKVLAQVPHATKADLDAALVAADKAYQKWRKVSAFERGKLLRKAAELVRARAEDIAKVLTQEQGKPMAESRLEVLSSADIIEWYAEEGRRTYGRLIPARADGVRQMVLQEPVGVVAGFSPWNFPINQAVRKISAALGAGCSIILKGPEETPGACAALVRAFADAGVPAGVVNLVFGVPAEISNYLIPHPIVRKVTFTGSTAVGKQLAALAGAHMKRVTMELGGHGPALICEDADVELASKILSANKFRNAGQVCTSPTRFLVHESVFDDFRDRFVTAAKAVKVGDGMEKGSTMGPLANPRRVDAMERFTADAVKAGARLATGGNRIGNKGNFFEPTVLTDVPVTARVMNEEPFGPLAILNRFSKLDDAISEANRLPYGLAAYAYTRSPMTAQTIHSSVESGMIAINNHGLALPEVPFGGIKDSGYGTEGGADALDGYLNTKFVTMAAV